MISLSSVQVKSSRRHHVDGARSDRGCVVVEDVEVAELRHREVEPRTHLVLVGEIDRTLRHHASARGPDQRDGLLGIFRLEVAADDGGAFGGEAQRGGAPLAATGTGDERHLARKSSRHRRPRRQVPAAATARQTRSGVIGMSTWRTP